MGSDYTRHLRNWRILHAILRPIINKKFDMTHEDICVEGPVLLIPNHVTSWDPLLVAMSLKDKQVYYVASEHLFRKGFLSRLLRSLVAPIPRSKGAVGTDTVKACLRHLRSGHSVCIFAEGEQSWDGRSGSVTESTGKLAKVSDATLVTYRLEGAYLCKPRWADALRRGKVYGHPVGIYPPEKLKEMTPSEITDSINRDIYEDAWERQKLSPQEYEGKDLAVGLERMLYFCPVCRKIGTLKTEGDRLFCSCGLETRFGKDGLFHPGSPFENLAEWEDCQRNALRSGDFVHGDELFSDKNVSLTKLEANHEETHLSDGRLVQMADRMEIGGHTFPLSDIDDMAMTRTHILLFSSGGTYYQLSAEKGINFRKYLEIFRSRS